VVVVVVVETKMMVMVVICWLFLYPAHRLKDRNITARIVTGGP
jgi:chromosome condensin MukBEF MukE localization factor